uniref:Class I SAM-dependent methyltransferase n=1 Tax=Thermofilum pendens TaxID=2269 RepID=A0A7C3SKM5_THEPE
MQAEFETRYVAEPFDRAAQTYDRGRLGWYKGVLSLLGGRVQEPLLDVGCGTGYIACRLAQQGLGSVVCLDLSEGMLRVAWRRARRWRVDAAVSFVQGSAAALPFRSHAFETVLAAAVVHHVYGRERRVAALSEIRRVCRGFALITVWSALHPSNLLRVLASRSRDVLVQWGGKGKRYYHLYTPGELAADLRAAGYEGFKAYLWDYKPSLLKRNIVVEYSACEAQGAEALPGG